MDPLRDRRFSKPLNAPRTSDPLTSRPSPMRETRPIHSAHGPRTAKLWNAGTRSPTRLFGVTTGFEGEEQEMVA
jgi:hypothetical protein